MLTLNIDAKVQRGHEQMIVHVDHAGETMHIVIHTASNGKYLKLSFDAPKSFSIIRDNAKEKETATD